MQGKFILLPDWMIRKMNQIKKRNGYSHSVLVRLALDDYFKKNLECLEEATKCLQEI